MDSSWDWCSPFCNCRTGWGLHSYDQFKGELYTDFLLNLILSFFLITLSCQHTFELLFDLLQHISSSSLFLFICRFYEIVFTYFTGQKKKKSTSACVEERTFVISCKLDFLSAKWPWANSILSENIWLLICEMKKLGQRMSKGFPCIKRFMIQYVWKHYAEF